MSRTLSPSSNVEALRREAKRWLKSLSSGDIDAAARFQRAFPGHASKPKLREIQHALAREYGFASWPLLKQELEDRARTSAERVSLFLEKSVNRYGVDPATQKWGDYERDGPARGALAARLLERHPDIARENIHTAVAAHDVDAVRAFLAEVAATLYYIARTHPAAALWPEGDVEAEAEVISWMSFVASTMHGSRAKGPEFVANALAVAERKLDNRQWAIGRFSIADIHLFRVYWRFRPGMEAPVGTYPGLEAHHDRMLARPAVQKALAAEKTFG